MKKIGIIGNGYVGGATALLANPELEVVIYDKDPEKCDPLGVTLEELGTCNFVFVAVPTPMNEDGKCVTSIVEEVVKDLSDTGFNKERIVVKSTVPVSTCEGLGVMFMPEFLTEKNWENDFRNQKDWILGTNNRNDELRNELYSIFKSAWENGALKQEPNMLFVETREAEMTKLVRNCYLATKVSFFNEIYDFCQTARVNYDKVREMVCLDTRIENSHTVVPGPDGKRGFGGTCFPKDMNSLLFQMRNNNNLPAYVIGAALIRNATRDRPEKDWEKDWGRAII